MADTEIPSLVKTIFQDVYVQAVKISDNLAASQDAKQLNTSIIQVIRLNTIKLRKIYVEILDSDGDEEYEAKLQQYMDSLIEMTAIYMSSFKLNMCDLNSTSDIDNIIIRFITNYYINWYKYEKSELTIQDQDDDKYFSHFDLFFKLYLKNIFNPLVSNKDPNIRYITLKMTILLFENFEELDVEDYKMIFSKIEERIFDRDEKVRSQAIIGLAKFQNDKNILKKFIFLLRNDTSPKIRKLIIATMISHGNSSSYSYVLERYIDKSVDVRKDVYTKFLLQRFKHLDVFRKIKNTLLIKILYNGFLIDRELSINELTFKIISTWYYYCDYDLVKLFSCFKIDDSLLGDKESLNKLESIFQNFVNYTLLKQKVFNLSNQKIKKNIAINFNFLSDENNNNNLDITHSFILKFLYKALSLNENIAHTVGEIYVPTTLEMIKLIKLYNPEESIEKKAIFLNLLEITTATQDFKDELSRRSMLQFVRNLIFDYKTNFRVEDGEEGPLLTDEELERQLNDEDEELVNIAPPLLKNDKAGIFVNQVVNSPFQSLSDKILFIIVEIVFQKLSLNNLDFLDIVMNIIWDMRDQEEEELERVQKELEKQQEPKDIGKKRKLPQSPEEEELDLPDLSDSDDDEDSAEQENIFVTKKPDLTAETLYRILKIAQVMLLQLPNPTINTQKSNQNSVSRIENNLYFESLIDTLITPAIRQSDSQILRNLAVSNLSLVCLLDINLMRENLHIFGMCASKSLPSLSDEVPLNKLKNALVFRDTSLKAILDALLSFDIEKLLPPDEEISGESEVVKSTEIKLFSIFKIFYKILKENESRKTDNLIVTGVFKLYLYQKIDHLDLLQLLILIYYYPVNSNNFKLLQTFASFIPTLCFSSIKNQNLLVELVPDLVFRLLTLYEENERSIKKRTKQVNKKKMLQNEKGTNKKGENQNESEDYNNSMEAGTEWSDFSYDDDQDHDIPKMKQPSQIVQELLYWTNPMNLKQHNIEDSQKESMPNHLKIIEILLFHYHKINEQDFIRFYKLMTKSKTQLQINKHHSLDLLLKLKLRIEYLNDVFDIPLLSIGKKKVSNPFYDHLLECIDENCKINNISSEKMSEIENLIIVEDEDMSDMSSD